jgi:hypothetical protein
MLFFVGDRDLIFLLLPSISLFYVHDGGTYFYFLLSLDYTTCGQNERTAGTSGGQCERNTRL